MTMTETRPRVALTKVLCMGRRKNGALCLHVLFMAEATDFNRIFTIKCDKCGTIAEFGPIG